MTDIQPPSPHESLSETGQQRRDQMLPQLKGAMHDLHRQRRRNRRTALAVVPILIIALGAIWWRTSSAPTSSPPTPIAIDIDPPTPFTPPIPAPRQVLLVDRIVTDPTILDRFKVNDHASIEIIDDTSLLALLAEMDRPTGLIATGGEVRLTRNVADTLAASPPPES